MLDWVLRSHTCKLTVALLKVLGNQWLLVNMLQHMSNHLYFGSNRLDKGWHKGTYKCFSRIFVEHFNRH